MRPLTFARYIAMSELRRSSSALDPSMGKSATPMLAVIQVSLPSSR